MTDRTQLPPDVRQFLRRFLDGVEPLDILLFLERERSQYWDAARVARALHMDDRTAAHHLETLTRRGLLDVRIASSVVYCFSPATPELAAAVQATIRAYSTHRTELLAFLSSRRLQSLKDFSDAFHVRRETKDG